MAARHPATSVGLIISSVGATAVGVTGDHPALIMIACLTASLACLGRLAYVLMLCWVVRHATHRSGSTAERVKLMDAFARAVRSDAGDASL